LELGAEEYSYGRHKDLDLHLDMLKKEFSGRTYLEFFHAATITFIRRRRNLGFCLSNFRKMWNEEGGSMQ
jgi:hypothetical protein